MATVADCVHQAGPIDVHGAAKLVDCETARSVRAQFRDSGYYFLRALTCHCHQGTLVLRGWLPTYYLKQVARTLAARVPGVRAVVDEIEIAEPERCISELRRWKGARQAVASE